jgi:WD40 repeat protein
VIHGVNVIGVLGFLRILHHMPRLLATAPQVFIGHEKPFTSVRLHHQQTGYGVRFVTTSNDGKVQLWDASTGAELITLPGASASTSRPMFSSDAGREVWQLLDSASYHDPNAATFVHREVPDVVEGDRRCRLARQTLGLSRCVP